LAGRPRPDPPGAPGGDGVRFLDGVEENFRFMVLEVTKQVENALKVLEKPDPALIVKVESRDDYIDNLKSVIENKCFANIHAGLGGDKRAVDMARAVNIITANLERLADHAVNIVMQSRYLRDPAFIRRYDYKAFFNEIIKALRLVVKALSNLDIALAFRICRSEVALDALFKANFDVVLADLRKGESPENCITAHNIFRYLERMGDTMLNIGEAVIFAAVGDKFKIHQFEALKGALAQSGVDAPITDGEFQSIWGTRSGCRIGKMEQAWGGEKPGGVIFKEGNPEKLGREMANITRWEAVLPGLAPRVQAFAADGDSAHILMDFLGGCTFQEAVLTGSPEVSANAAFVLTQTVERVWLATRHDEPLPGQFMRQMARRMDDVFRMHPWLRTPPMTLAGLPIPGFEELAERAAALEENLPAPFTVFVHGDFNINNIVYAHEEERVHYIDLHRSRQADYIQDVSVFLVSNFRLPVLDPEIRRRLNGVMSGFLGFARRFAAKAGDPTFDARLALGLARSFVTSSRFEFNRRFAREMAGRGVYLLGRLLAWRDAGKPLETFAAPDTALIY
jgi:phosphate uptake regulator